MIEAQAVTKKYGEIAALEEVSFSIAQGEIVGLLGPNGAGKTTLIRALTGYFEPSAGTIRIDGIDVEADPVAVQSVVGYLPEQNPLYPEMLVQEYLVMAAEFRGVPPDLRRRRLSEAIYATGLEEHLTRPIGELSKGFRQRVGLAQAILHRPKVLILDEPTGGLDPTQVVQVRELVRRLAESATVLFSTHILTEVEQVCERAIVLIGGRVRSDARMSELQASHQAVVAVASSGSNEEAVNTDLVRRTLGELEGVVSVETAAPRAGYLTFELSSTEERDLCREVYRLARERGWELGELRPVVRGLESVFRELVAGGDQHIAATGEEVAR